MLSLTWKETRSDRAPLSYTVNPPTPAPTPTPLHPSPPALFAGENKRAQLRSLQPPLSCAQP